MNETEQLRSELADVKAKLKVVEDRTRPPIGEREMELLARTPQHPVETWMDFLNRRRMLFMQKHGRDLRYIVERQATGYMVRGVPQHVTTYLLEDGSSSNGNLDGHREPDEWGSVMNLKWRLRYWQAYEKEHRELLQDAYAQATAANNNSPEQLALLEKGKAVVAEAVANQHAIKQRLQELDPKIREWERQQAEGKDRQFVLDQSAAYHAQAQAKSDLHKVYTSELPTVAPTIDVGGK